MELQGKSVFGGIAIGKLSIYNKGENVVKRTKIDDVEAEVKRFEGAKETAKAQLKGLYEKVVFNSERLKAFLLRSRIKGNKQK